MINPKRPYSRIEIDKEFRKVKEQMHKEAQQRGLKQFGEEVAYHTDVYTGTSFKGGDNYEYEHIRSSENVFEKYKSSHTDKEIALIVNCAENIGVTSFEINRHKDKYRIEDRILKYPEKIRKYNINLALTKENVEKADASISKLATEILEHRKNIC